MKHFDSTKRKYVALYMAMHYLTNYMHRRHLDFTYTVLECNDDEDDDGCDGDVRLEKVVSQGWT